VEVDHITNIIIYYKNWRWEKKSNVPSLRTLYDPPP
jgi:hypothetical protein